MVRFRDHNTPRHGNHTRANVHTKITQIFPHIFQAAQWACGWCNAALPGDASIRDDGGVHWILCRGPTHGESGQWFHKLCVGVVRQQTTPATRSLMVKSSQAASRAPVTYPRDPHRLRPPKRPRPGVSAGAVTLPTRRNARPDARGAGVDLVAWQGWGNSPRSRDSCS